MGSFNEDGSFFNAVEFTPPDAIFELTQLYNSDPFPEKVNLGQGTYKDGNGQPWILPSVRAAKMKIREANHEYLPILGLPEFREQATELVYGKDAAVIAQNRVAACQSLSGTGALHLAGVFLRQTLPSNTPVCITRPSWSNHRQVFETIGFEVCEFQWYSEDIGRLDLQSVLETLSQAPAGSIIVLHGSAHNPSGCDPSKEEWQKIASIIKDRGLLPLFDSAYLGITSGDFDEDAWAIHYFVNELGLEAVVCLSFAKNMGLYGERVGHVSIVSRSAESATAVQSKLAQWTRAEISNPPAFGARIVATVLGDEDLREQWRKDLVTMSLRIKTMRNSLYEGLKKRNTPGDWKRIVEQKGMFCILGISVEQVLSLRSKHHIYMADSSRVSIAGLNWSNVEYVADAIHDVVIS
ncbi:pyridoxal phosphate-dependent transferase [Mariannaea sp. PMI_226]|nr:pyridoxal phosphate-dependent transferase [Mariannaea sp. PMI_226]